MRNGAPAGVRRVRIASGRVDPHHISSRRYRCTDGVYKVRSAPTPSVRTPGSRRSIRRELTPTAILLSFRGPLARREALTTLPRDCGTCSPRDRFMSCAECFRSPRVGTVCMTWSMRSSSAMDVASLYSPRVGCHGSERFEPSSSLHTRHDKEPRQVRHICSSR